MSTNSPSRRHALRALGAAVILASSAPFAIPCVAAQGQPASGSAAGHLIVGDTSAGKVHFYSLPEFSLAATIDDLALGAHAGVIVLPDGRVLIPDDRNKQLVVLRLGQGTPMVERRVPMPIPLPSRYAWAAADPKGQVFAATNLDSDESVKLLTLVDLQTYAAKQFRVDVGAADAEFNIALGGSAEPVVVLHASESANAYRVADLMGSETKINAILDETVKPTSTLQLARGGHSNSFSAATSKWTGSTSRGFEIATLDGGALSAHRTLSWEANELGGGRNARQRLTHDGRHAFGPLNASVPPGQWADAEVDLHWVDLANETTKRVPLARGAVGRGGVSQRLAVYPSIHPEGDHANLVSLDQASPNFREVVARVPLAKLANGPVPGTPTSGTEGRFAAISPDGRFAFVTHGGEGKISVIDTAAKAVVRTITTPTPLRGGGYVAGVQPGTGQADFSAR